VDARVMSNRRAQRRERRRRRYQPESRRERHGLNVVDYLDEMDEVRAEAREQLSPAGERALKVLDRFLANLATAFGMDNERATMADSIRYLERITGAPSDIAALAERLRGTRNALAHNPDLTLRPEAAVRIIDGVETIIRMAAEEVRDLTRRGVVTALDSEPLEDARDRLLAHRYDQLVVVDAQGGVIDLLTDRDIVLMEAEADATGADLEVTVAEAIGRRGHTAVALLPLAAAADEAVAALRDERAGAVVLTEHGELGEPPLGIITRKDLLKAL
jgi:CBS domain-containing protein